MDGFVDDLAEAEAHGDGAEDVGVDGGEGPAGDEEIDHAEGSVLGCGGEVGAGGEDDPGVGVGVGRERVGGFDDGAGERLLFVEMKAEGEVEGALDAVDADLAVSLGGVAVAAGEEGSGDEDGKVEGGAGGELADVEVAAEGAGRAGAEFAVLCAGDAHDTGEGTEGDDGGHEGAGGVFVKLPVEEVGVAEVVLEEAEAFDDAGPAPAVVLGVENVDLEDVAGFGGIDIDGASEGVDEGAVDLQVMFRGHDGMDLGAAGVDASDLDGVAGGDMEARREGAVPDGVGGMGGEGVDEHIFLGFAAKSVERSC